MKEISILFIVILVGAVVGSAYIVFVQSKSSLETLSSTEMLCVSSGFMGYSGLAGYLGTNHPSTNSSTSAHGSVFLASYSFRISEVTLFLTTVSSLVPVGADYITTTNLTVNIYNVNSQSFTALPTGKPLETSLPINATALVNYAPQNFTFVEGLTLKSGTYYGLELQADGAYISNSARVLILFYNTTVSDRTVNMFQNGRWLIDGPAVDCTVQMKIYGYMEE